MTDVKHEVETIYRDEKPMDPDMDLALAKIKLGAVEVLGQIVVTFSRPNPTKKEYEAAEKALIKLSTAVSTLITYDNHG